MGSLTRPLQVVAVAVWAIAIAQAASVVIVDSNVNSVVQHSQHIPLCPKALAVADAALLRLQPPYALSATGSTKASQLFVPKNGAASQKKMLEHPTAFLFLSLNGLENGDTQLIISSLKTGTYSTLDVASSARREGLSVLQGLHDLASHNPDVQFHRLGRFANQECDELCLPEAVRQVADVVGGEYTQAASLDGMFKMGSAYFDLKQPDARLFVIELALFFKSAKSTLLTAQSAQDVLVMDMVFTNLGSLGEEAAASAVKAIMQVVDWIENQCTADNKGRFAYQVAFLGSANIVEIEEIMQPKAIRAPSRRLQASEAVAAEEQQVKKFSNSATIYGAAFVLIYFTFAGIYCLTAMDFKQDTLLYSKGKVD